MTEASTSPGALWSKAHAEHPDDADARRARYLDLMSEHGHIVPKDHPDASPGPLPCGYDLRKGA